MRTLNFLFFTLLCFAFHSDIHGSYNSTHDEPISTTISDIPPSGIVISLPGTYVFDRNIQWSPSGDGQAILIVADDVTLDLNDYTLESVPSSYNTIGIAALSAGNLTIKNGTVANMRLGGIKCDECVNILIKNFTIDRLTLQNTATYTVPVGILVTNSIAAVIYKCTVQNIDVRTGSTAAIQMTETLSSKISHCTVRNMINRDGACTGIGHLLCDAAEVKSCTLDTLETQFINNLNTEGHTAIGIVPVASSNLLIKNCKISNITGCCDDAHGMSIFECLGAIVKNCKVENVLDGAGAAQTGAKATGIEVYASAVQVIDCSVKNIKAINPQDKQATGFSCAQCIGVEFVECKAEDVSVVDQNGVQNPALGYGTGFGWAPDPRPEFIVPAVDTLYRRCTAKNCQVGFDSWYHINSLWEDIEVICCQIPILDLNQPPRTLSCDPCSECGCLQTGCYPTPRTVTINNIAKNNIFADVLEKSCKN